MKQTQQQIKQKAQFFSLKWKAALLLSLIIISINVGLTSLAYKNQIQHFIKHNQVSNLRNKQEVKALLQGSSNRLQQLQSVISNLEGMPKVFENMQWEPLRHTFNKHWLSMEFDWGLSRIEFYNNNSHAVGIWPEPPQSSALESQIKSWVRQVNKTEIPLNTISCFDSCSQYSIIPMLNKSEKIGVIVLSVSIADSIISFKTITGNNIGIITKTDQSGHLPMQQLAALPNWDYSITSLTSAADTQNIVQLFAQQFEDINQISLGQEVSSGTNYYELVSTPLNDSAENLILILRNITAEKNLINSNIKQILLISFLGLIISELILFLVLSRLVRRLRNTTKSLPLLATGMYSQARQKISTEITRINKFNDEIDQLNNSAITLSFQLEEYTLKEKKHNSEISQKIKEIQKAHDFNQVILDTAQVIILVLDKDAMIIEISLYGQQLSGYSAEYLVGKSFADLHSDRKWLSRAMKDLQSLSRIVSGELNQYKHEATLSSKNGNSRNIIWTHSPLKSERFTSSRILSVGLDITERKLAEDQLGWLADHDPLTELFNRRRFEDELKRTLNWSRRYRHQGALLYIDLDNFKEINDISGHQAGDAILQSVAMTLKTITRDSDILGHLIAGRLGGDEFAIIMKETDEQGALILANRILESFNKIHHIENTKTHSLGGCIGIAMFPTTESNLTELLSNADSAMYQAKTLGRNRAHLFSAGDSHRKETQHRMKWRNKIEQAFKEDRFVLFFQPILHISSKTISHYEVLIRMLDDNGEIIPPGEFIGIAEQLGLINSIDNYVLRTAIFRQAELNKQGHDITLALNLSGKAFDDPHLVGNIEQALIESGANAGKIIFEITETAAVSDIAAANKMMVQIKNLGCHFALDDFGVGFSSFYYLKELPVDIVKIDGSFIKDLPVSPDNRVLVKALSEVAIGFSKLTVAEFVDSYETLEILEKDRVTYAQGFYIGKPSAKIPVDPPIFSS